MSDVRIKCASCGHLNTPGGKNCASCGAPIFASGRIEMSALPTSAPSASTGATLLLVAAALIGGFGVIDAVLSRGSGAPIIAGVFLAVLARIAQAGKQHRELVSRLDAMRFPHR